MAVLKKEHLEKCSTARKTLQILPADAVPYFVRALGQRRIQETAGVSLPQLRPVSEPGEAILLLVENLERETLIGPGIALPVRWDHARDWDEHLPHGIREQAERVANILDAHDWCLRLGPPLAGQIDLSRLSVSPDSAFAPLAAALEVARQGGRPEPLVFATGDWTGKWFGRVSGVEAKVQTVAEFAATLGRQALFFVPAANLEEAQEAAGRLEGVQVQPFPLPTSRGRSERDALLADLAGLLGTLHVPPPDSAPEEQQIAYGNLPYVAGNRSRRAQFYEERLLGPIADRLRRELAQISGSRKLYGLVCSLSKRPEVAALAALTFRPQVLRLLVTQQTDQGTGYWEHFWTLLAKGGYKGDKSRPFVWDPESPGSVIQEMAEWLEPLGDHGAVEITGGRSDMTAALVLAASKAGARVFYVDHEVAEGGRYPRFGTERLVELPSRSSGSQDGRMKSR